MIGYGEGINWCGENSSSYLCEGEGARGGRRGSKINTKLIYNCD